MSADYCVICGCDVPEGRQVCPICDMHASVTHSPPTGYITAHDVSQLSALRGHQILSLLEDYGTVIGGKAYIKFEVFDRLRMADKLSRYQASPVYGPKIRTQGWRRKRK